MKRRLLFLLAVFAATTLLMALQKPVFLLFHAAQAAEAPLAERLLVLWHGLSLDMTVAGYVTALPLLATLASLWCRCPTGCGAACSGATSSSCRSSRRPSSPSILRSTATGVSRIDATILIYLSDPEGGAGQHRRVGEAVRQVLLVRALGRGDDMGL